MAEKRKAVVFSSNIERVAAGRETKRRLAEPYAIYEPDVFQTLLQHLNGEEQEEKLDNALSLLLNDSTNYSKLCFKALEWLDLLSDATPHSKQKNSERFLADFFKKLLNERMNENLLTNKVESLDKCPKFVIELLEEPYFRNFVLEKKIEKPHYLPVFDYLIKLMIELGYHDDIKSKLSISTYYTVYKKEVLEILKRIANHRNFPSSPYDIHIQPESDLYHLEHSLLKLCQNSKNCYLFTIKILERLVNNDTVSQIMKLKYQRLLALLPQSIQNMSYNDEKKEYYNEYNIILEVITKKIYSTENLQKLKDFDFDAMKHKYYHYQLVSILMKQVFSIRYTSYWSNAQNQDSLVAATHILSRLTKTDLKAIEDSVSLVLAENVFDVSVFNSKFEEMREIVKMSHFCSYAIIFWFSEHLMTTKFYQSSHITIIYKKFYELVRLVIDINVLQLKQVFIIFKSLFLNFKKIKMNKNFISDIKRLLVQNFVYLMSKGYVLPIIDFFQDLANKGEINEHLLRHFIILTFKTISQPFSKEFVSHLTLLLETQTTKKALSAKTTQVHLLKKMVMNFYNSVRK